MKTIQWMAGAVAALVLLAVAAQAAAADKEVTLTGEGKCAKCALKVSDKCQNVIQVTKDGKTETYFLVDNQVSKDFHPKICTSTQKVKATGTVKKSEGKDRLEFIPKKIELADTK
jgi:hypothetical protein